MNEQKLQALMAEYQKNLTASVTASPGTFSYPVTKVPEIVTKAESWIRLGVRTVIYNTPTWKLTFKTLGIKPTHKAIAEFLETPL